LKHEWDDVCSGSVLVYRTTYSSHRPNSIVAYITHWHGSGMPECFKDDSVSQCNSIKKCEIQPYCSCWKWPAVPFPRYLLTTRVTQLLMGVWPSYLSPRSAGGLTARTLNSLDNSRPVLRVIVCYSTRENSQTCRPHALIGRQRLSLRSSRQWAQTAQLSSARGRGTDLAPKTTVRALRQPSGFGGTTPGPTTTSTGEDAETAGSERLGGSERRDGSKLRGSSVQRGRRTTCPSTPPLSHWSSHRTNSPSAKSPTLTRKHPALPAVLRLLVTAFFLYVRPLLC